MVLFVLDMKADVENVASVFIRPGCSAHCALPSKSLFPAEEYVYANGSWWTRPDTKQEEEPYVTLDPEAVER